MDASVRFALSAMVKERLRATLDRMRVLSRIDDKSSGYLGQYSREAYPALQFVARKLLRMTDARYAALRTIYNVLEGSKTEHISCTDLTDALPPDALFLFCCSCASQLATVMPVEDGTFSEVQFVVPFDDDHTFYFRFHFDDGSVRISSDQMIRYTSSGKE